MNIFNEIDRFFSSLYGYLSLNDSLLIFLGIFLFVIIATIISTSRAYESKLIKAVDMFNNYFINNPQIDESNLVSFNNRMKMRNVPKQLRKQWQQFVLYREHPASHYMSFEICVSSPLKNSTFKRDITTMNILAYILAILSFLFNLYSVLVTDLVSVLQQTLLCPIFILILNYIVTIFLDLRHNAIVSDLNQNYQYFEVNMDKATQTLPEYVDYEVLFDKNEIKRGIPILYSYLQRRAEEEKKELERARLRNVEHEKFNFDEAGVESSLVLERAMQEAESYIAERKKFMQDMEQINNDISQEELNFRETTKEYQRQMQVSKESFENFKAQLNEAASAIEANYLKKQQQQELDRQRNLERDYDTASDRHKKILEGYQEELTAIENEIKAVRTNLEKGMMSEFDTYSAKVYEAAKKQAEASQSKKMKGLQDKIKELEAKLSNTTNVNNSQVEQTSEQVQNNDSNEIDNSQVQNNQVQDNRSHNIEAINEDVQNSNIDNQSYSFNYYEDGQSNVNENVSSEFNNDSYNISDNQNTPSIEQEGNAVDSSSFDTVQIESSKPKKKVGRPRKEKVETEHRPVGRPKKITTDETSSAPAKKVGRPKKTQVDSSTTEKKKVGRPKKEITQSTKKKVGRPRKETANTEVVTTAKRGRGRPKKSETNDIESQNDTAVETVDKTKRKVGRPKKVVEGTEVNNSENKDNNSNENAPIQIKRRGRPKKIVNDTIQNDSNEQGMVESNVNPTGEVKDIDAYLKEIDAQIAEENAKIEETTKELEKKSRISRRTSKK